MRFIQWTEPDEHTEDQSVYFRYDIFRFRHRPVGLDMRRQQWRYNRSVCCKHYDCEWRMWFIQWPEPDEHAEDQSVRFRYGIFYFRHRPMGLDMRRHLWRRNCSVLRIPGCEWRMRFVQR